MYKNVRVNIAIFLGSFLLFLLTLWLVRSQATVDDVDYMKAMIPHHSIAIMTSERAQLTDPRVKKLATEIAEAQRREISEMKYLVQNPAVNSPIADKPLPKVVSASEAIGSPDIPTIDPGPLHKAEIDKVLPAGERCIFYYTSSGLPILATGIGTDGIAKSVLKIHGRLVELVNPQVTSFGNLLEGGIFSADPIRFEVRPESGDRGRVPAEAHFRIGDEFSVGYKGYYRCGSKTKNERAG